MQAWDKFLELQEKELGKETVAKWLRSLKILRYDACNLYLEAKDAFQVMWFEEHFRKKTNEQFLNNNRKKIKVHLSIPKSESVPQNKTPEPNVHAKAAPQKFSLTFDVLDPQCTFQNYLPSEENELTFKVLCKVVGYDYDTKDLTPQAELCGYNPIYLCGASGTGKTHLLLACAHTLQKRGLTVLYCRADTFTEHVVSAIRSGEMIKFRQAYRNIDVLIVDDVQVFSRKGATQEEFFHTFNTLHLGGKQIILSANCLPGELQAVEPRLISRFEWGVVLQLEPLNDNDLNKLLQYNAQELDFKLNPKVSEFLIETFKRSPKSLKRALNALVLRTHLNERNTFKAPPPNTVPLAREYLSDLIKEEERMAITPEKIIDCVRTHFGITAEDVLSKSQNRECVMPRQIAMFLCRTELKLPYMKIGTIFSRDHSTVMSSIKQIQKGIEYQENEIVFATNSIIKKLKQKETPNS